MANNDKEMEIITRYYTTLWYWHMKNAKTAFAGKQF